MVVDNITLGTAVADPWVAFECSPNAALVGALRSRLWSNIDQSRIAVRSAA